MERTIQNRKYVTRREMLNGAVAGAAGITLNKTSVRAVAAVPAPAAAHAGVTREYWVQADSFPRTLMSTGKDDLFARIYGPDDSTFWSLGFRAYTPNWGKLLPAEASLGPNDGIPGPVIRGNVGDTILIHFKNNDTHYGFPHSIHVHGLVYTPENDGAWISTKPDAPGTAIKPGETYTYRYKVAPSSVGTWVYHDHSMPQSLTGQSPVMELSAQLGMVGLIAIDDPAAPRADREHILFLHQMYAADVPVLVQDFACFNGAAYFPNTPNFQAKVGERVRWRIGALGQEFYAFHLHGHRWRAGGEYADTVILGPSTTATFDYIEDNPGAWFYHCQSTAHLTAGMIGQYTVTA